MKTIRSFLVPILGIFFLFGSCSNDSREKLLIDNLFSFYNEDIEKDIYLIEKHINEKDDLILNNDDYDSYLIRTTEYLNYLEKLCMQYKNTRSNPFFENNKISKEGEAFINKSEQYVLFLKNNPFFLNRNQNSTLIDLLSVENVLTSDHIYVGYIDYYFAGSPENLFIYSMRVRQKNTLIIKNELINNYLLEQIREKW